MAFICDRPKNMIQYVTLDMWMDYMGKGEVLTKVGIFCAQIYKK